MAGCLSIVATPIGNLEDITLRALRVLREADLIAAEDTRRTARLLQHYSISTPTTSLHAHNERRKTPILLARLEAGARVALVCDAGTPTVSDPGARLVAEAIDRGIRIEPVPGPSAVTAAVAASGFPADRFTFLGFPPAKGSARENWLRNAAADPGVVVFFEAPHRIESALGLLAKLCGSRVAVVLREVTKQHEELVKGPIASMSGLLSRRVGEFTVVLGPLSDESLAPELRTLGGTLRAEFERMTKERGLSRREAISTIAKSRGLSARSVYAAIERAKTD